MCIYIEIYVYIYIYIDIYTYTYSTRRLCVAVECALSCTGLQWVAECVASRGLQCVLHHVLQCRVSCLAMGCGGLQCVTSRLCTNAWHDTLMCVTHTYLCGSKVLVGYDTRTSHSWLICVAGKRVVEEPLHEITQSYLICGDMTHTHQIRHSFVWQADGQRKSSHCTKARTLISFVDMTHVHLIWDSLVFQQTANGYISHSWLVCAAGKLLAEERHEETAPLKWHQYNLFVTHLWPICVAGKWLAAEPHEDSTHPYLVCEIWHTLVSHAWLMCVSCVCHVCARQTASGRATRWNCAFHLRRKTRPLR